MKIFEEWLEEKSGWDSEHPKYIFQFNVGLNVYYKKKTSKNFSFTKLDWDINDYITDNIKEADIQDTPDKFKALKKELEVKYPKVIMYLFPNKKVRLSVTTYYTFKEEQESLYKNEQEMFTINEGWSSDITKAFGKQFLTYQLSQFLNSRDIDIAKSDYEIIKSPFTTKKFRQYEYAIVKWQNPIAMTTPEVCVYHFEKNGNLLVYDVSRNIAVASMPIAKEFIHAAVGIKKVVRNTELKQKRKDDYEDTRAAKERDPINANRVKRIMRSFKE